MQAVCRRRRLDVRPAGRGRTQDGGGGRRGAAARRRHLLRRVRIEVVSDHVVLVLVTCFDWCSWLVQGAVVVLKPAEVAQTSTAQHSTGGLFCELHGFGDAGPDFTVMGEGHIGSHTHTKNSPDLLLQDLRRVGGGGIRRRAVGSRRDGSRLGGRRRRTIYCRRRGQRLAAPHRQPA